MERSLHLISFYLLFLIIHLFIFLSLVSLAIVCVNDTIYHTLYITSLLNIPEKPDTEDMNQLNIFVQLKLKTPLLLFQ